MAIEGSEPLSVLHLAQGLGQQLAGGLAPAQPPRPHSPPAAATAPQAQGAAGAGADAAAAGGAARAPAGNAASGAAWPVPAAGSMRELVCWGGALMPTRIKRGLASPAFFRPATGGGVSRMGDLSKVTPSEALQLPERGDELLAPIKAGGVPGVKFIAEERGAGGAVGVNPPVWRGTARKHVTDPVTCELLPVFEVEGSAAQCLPVRIGWKCGDVPHVRPCYLENMGPHAVLYLFVRPAAA